MDCEYQHGFWRECQRCNLRRRQQFPEEEKKGGVEPFHPPLLHSGQMAISSTTP